MHTKRFFVAFVILLVNYQLSLSQDHFDKKQVYIEGYYHYGFVAPHHDFIAYFINEHVKGFQVNLGVYTVGNKYWNQYYNYPKIGIGYYRSGLGNAKVYGQMNALYGYVDRSFFNLKSRVNLANRVCFGLAYLSKKFDLYENNYNVAIGSHLNVFLQYNLEGTIKISPLLQIKTGFSFIHSSNGNVHEPNKGLNLVTSFIGLQYSMADQVQNIRKDSPINDDPSKNQFITSLSYGWKSISRLHSFEYPVYAISAEYARKISSKGWLGVAITGYIDRSIKKEYENQIFPDTTFKTSDYYSIALNPSYELKMGKLSFLFQPGIYLKYNSFCRKEYNLITNRIGLRYYFRNNLIAGVAIKAHWAGQADFIEWSIGYRLKK